MLDEDVGSLGKSIATRVRTSDKRPAPDKVRTPDRETVALVSEVWQAMVAAVLARREQMAAQAATFHLTLPQARLLRLVEFAPVRTMASLARALSCDASNVTGLVDRLETRGLIRRDVAAHDRRSKTLVVTAAGAAVNRALERKTFAPPRALRRLTRQQLSALHEMMEQTFPTPSEKARADS